MKMYPNLNTIAFIGNYLPRKCGIATFTNDLLNAVSTEAPQLECWALAMNDIIQGYPYPSQVRFDLNAKLLADYKLAAEYLNVNKVDIVCLQHEFGIYGGKYGSHILTLLKNLRMPIVTTLHTHLLNPNLKQKEIINTIVKISDRIIVMSKKAEMFLKDNYNVSKEKINLVHHGIPDFSFIDPNFFKAQFGVEGKKVLMTFGLISPSKGIEIMIEALPEIIRKYPDVIYIVLGATHPNLKREQGESYRHLLQIKARALGVEDHIIFHNRFVELKELCEFLGVADIYITPYLNKEQIVSGTLAYALGAGKAIISTPYWYAEEILADGRGIIVPFKDSKSIANQICFLLENEVERHNIRKNAYMFGRNMIWKEVARKYLDIFDDVKENRLLHPKTVFQKKYLRFTPFEMPYPKFDHLFHLTDDVGILQHANYIIPNRFHGYCSDDNARALVAVLLAQKLSFEEEFLRNFGYRYLSFILYAFNEENNRFRNFMGYDRTWIEEMGSEDCHGRAIWALGVTVAISEKKEASDIVLDIFEKAVSTLSDFNSPRALAFGLVGIHAYLERFSGDIKIKQFRKEIANKLFSFYCNNASDDWPWIEDMLAYDNGKIPHALIMSGHWLQRGDMIEAGIKSLDWLIKIQTNKKGQFSPIGNNGWYPKNGEKARFDQQPIEAQSVLEACSEAYKITQDKNWIVNARRCLEWYLGRNDMNLSLYDYKTGGCYDSITPTGINRNQGAEATLACLLSFLNMYSLDDVTAIDLGLKLSESVID